DQNPCLRPAQPRTHSPQHSPKHGGFGPPHLRRNEILRLVEGGLVDISMSRAGQSWGIPLPWDPTSVVYVWFDALINYASAVGLGGDRAMFEKWWPADLHVIGKDITRFHAVIWPAMLMAAKLPLPRRIFGHGFMTIGGQRMSKTLGTIIDPIVAADRLGHDPLRLYLVKEISFGGDGDFSWERYDERYNVDLANNLGNLVSRVTSMAHRYRQGRLAPAGAPSEQLARLGSQVIANYRSSMDALALHEGAAQAYRLIDGANEYIAATSPWTLANDPEKAGRLTQVLFDAAEAIRLAAVLLEPIMPSSCREILRRVGVSSEGLNFDRDGVWRNAGERALLQEGPLWPRVGADARLGPKETTTVSDNPLPPEAPSPGAHPPPAPVASPAAAAADARITIDDFMKVELRVAKVLTAEKVEKSKKLLKLSVDVGTEHRTLVAGIAEAYEPDSLVGKTVVVVFNLKPAKLMGIESNGMVLAASPDGGKPAVVTFETPPDPGTRVRGREAARPGVRHRRARRRLVGGSASGAACAFSVSVRRGRNRALLRVGQEQSAAAPLVSHRDAEGRRSAQSPVGRHLCRELSPVGGSGQSLPRDGDAQHRRRQVRPGGGAAAGGVGPAERDALRPGDRRVVDAQLGSLAERPRPFLQHVRQVRAGVDQDRRHARGSQRARSGRTRQLPRAHADA